MLSLTGCLIADPPQYEEPRRTPPFLDLDHAEPSPYWPVIVEKKPSVDLQLKVLVRSDDQGEQLWFGLHVDYKANSHIFLKSLPIAPSTLDQPPRVISVGVDIDERFSPGCHQLTLLVAHHSSWDLDRGQPYPEAPDDDLAIATWWMNVDPNVADDPFSLLNCPNQSEVQQ
jgi:hypothetical protein